MQLRDMEDAKRKNRRRRPGGDAPEMRVVGIDFKPAPDGEEQLRRLFTILVKLVEDDPSLSGTDPSPDDGNDEEP